MNDISKPRIFKFDNVKLLVVTLIVVGSFAEELADQSDMFRSWFIFVYSFHYPLFIFLSGLFQKPFQKDSRPSLHKITLYLMLGYALKLIIYFLRRMNGEDIGLDMLGGATIEWYLFVIVMYTVTLYVLKNVNRYIVLAGALILGLAAGFFPLGDEFYLMRYFVFLPFYTVGYYLTPAKVRRFSHYTAVKLVGISFMLVYFVLCFRLRENIYPLRMLFTGRNPYSIVPIDGCSFYHRLLCYGISAMLIVSVIASIPNRRIPILTRMGRNTLAVYFWNFPLVLILWQVGMFDMLFSLGDPVWKIAVLSIAVLAALVLAIPLFSYPLRKLEQLISKLPVPVCFGLDFAMLFGAVATNIILPY